MTKVAELEGAELDYWVARAEGLNAELSKTCPIAGYAVYEDCVSCWTEGLIDDDEPECGSHWSLYEPTENWQQCGPLVEKHGVGLNPNLDGWGAYTESPDNEPYPHGAGPTPQIAICRCVVASVYGEEVAE